MTVVEPSTASPSSVQVRFPNRIVVGGMLEETMAHLEVIDPASGAVLAKSPDTSREQLDRAVTAARKAQRAWSTTDFANRRALIDLLARAMEDHEDELAILTTLEQGKPLAAARAEVKRAAASMREIANIEIARSTIKQDAASRVDLIYRPLGVIGAITPWNVPLVLAAPKIASALYAGNAVILKPAPSTPFGSLRLGELFAKIAPEGLISVLSGGNALGQWMSEHHGIDKISFTGSVETGKKVMASCAGTLKRTTLELGGNDPAIVLPDADIDAFAPALFAGAFGLSGQLCMGIKRLYAHRSIFDRTVAALAELARSAMVGSGMEPGVTVGPLQNRVQFEKVMDLIADTRANPKAHIHAGGYALDRPGYFIAPTIVTGLSEGTRLVDEEQFGPVLPILAFDDIDEVVARANDSPFGLGASVWTGDIDLGSSIAARLEAGYTWVNAHVGTTRDLPFGGMKQSGIGRQGHFIGVTGDMEPQVIVTPMVSNLQ